jgi:hypothetical protein
LHLTITKLRAWNHERESGRFATFSPPPRTGPHPELPLIEVGPNAVGQPPAPGSVCATLASKSVLRTTMIRATVRESVSVAGRTERARVVRAFVGAVLGPGHPGGDDAVLQGAVQQ